MEEESTSVRSSGQTVQAYDQSSQVNMCFYNSAKRYKYGVEILRNYEDAVRLDALNGNTAWLDAIAKEMGPQIEEYEVFKDNGYEEPKDQHKKIKVHLVFNCKHDGRRKGRLVGKCLLWPCVDEISANHDFSRGTQQVGTLGYRCRQRLP